MRVTIASRIFDPEPAAAAFRLAALARALRNQGDDVTVLTTRVGRKNSSSLTAVKIRRWPVLRNRQGQVRGYLQYLSFDIPLLFRLLFSARPDIVVVEPPPTTGAVVKLVAQLRRFPYVYYAADIWSDAVESVCAPKFVSQAMRRIEADVLAKASAVLAVTEGVEGRVMDLAPHANIHLVGNGIDTSIFTMKGESRGLTNYAVYAGTASEWQGAEVFLHATAKLNESRIDVPLVFLGGGVQWEKLKQLALDLGLRNVRFLDTVPQTEAAIWIRSATVALVSLRAGQGYDFAVPTKIYAALACGVPVLFAGKGAATTLIGENNLGWTSNHNPNEVANALSQAMSTPATTNRRAQLSAWARQNASLSSVADRCVAVVHSLFSVKPSPNEIANDAVGPGD